MYRSLFRLVLAVAVALASLTVGLAQDRPKDPDDYRRFFRAPETPLEYWKAIQFELEVGRPDLAVKHIQNYLATKPQDKDWFSIIDSVGLTPILKLRGVGVWNKDDKVNQQALADVKRFVDQASAAASRRRKSAERIDEFIGQLKKTEEERIYALRELYKSGPFAMPPLIKALGKAADAEDRLPVLQAIESMNPADSVAPLIAALDSKNARMKVDILAILKKKHARFAALIVPHLWYPSANKDEDAAVRKKTRELLAYFLELPEGRLHSAKVSLTREAEKFYQKQARFGDEKDVIVWRWDDKDGTVRQGWPGAETITPAQANEYWGLRFARQALTLDPAYRPAQSVFLGLAIQSRGAEPEVKELLAKASTELLIEMLERALKEDRRAEAIAALRALGNRAEVRAKRPGNLGDSALVRALYYPDPRVQMEAVETLLLIPGAPPPKTGDRIVKILAQQLNPMASYRGGRKVLLAISDDAWRTKIGQGIDENIALPIGVSNGRDVMRQLRANADIDAVILDSTLPDPGLAHLLAQIRADVDFGRVPILVAAIPQTRTAVDLAACWERLGRKLDVLDVGVRLLGQEIKKLAEDESAAFREIERTEFFRREDRYEAEEKVRDKYRRQRAALDKQFLDRDTLQPNTDLRKEAERVAKLEAKRDLVSHRYDLESRVREGQLDRFTSRYANVRVVHPSLFTNARALEATVRAMVRTADVSFTQKERDGNAEVAIAILSNLAQGRPSGYDVRPVSDVIVSSLRNGRLSPRGQIAAIDAVARLPGKYPNTAAPQEALLNAMLDEARPKEVRVAAGEGLVLAMQRHGILLTGNQVRPLCELVRQPKLDPDLKRQFDVVIGALRPSDRETGKLLRKFDPQPVAPIPPPKEKDKDDKGEKKDKDKDEKKEKEKE